MSFPKKVSMPTASANPTGAPRRPGSAGRTRRRNPPATEACVQPVTNSGEKSAPARCGFGHSGPHALPPTSSGEGTKRRTRATRPRRVPAYLRRAAAMPPSTSASCMSARPGGRRPCRRPQAEPADDDHVAALCRQLAALRAQRKARGSAAHECHKCLQQGLGARRTDPSANGLLGHRAVPWMSAMALSAPVGG